MAKMIDMRLIGDARAIERELKRLARAYPDVLAAAMYAEGWSIQAQAVRNTPVEFGVLRSSAYTSPPTKDGKGGFVVEVGFGTDYAVYQHESEGLKHPRGGRAKYLQAAVADASSGFIERIRKRTLDFAERGVTAKAVSGDGSKPATKPRPKFSLKERTLERRRQRKKKAGEKLKERKERNKIKRQQRRKDRLAKQRTRTAERRHAKSEKRTKRKEEARLRRSQRRYERREAKREAKRERRIERKARKDQAAAHRKVRDQERRKLARLERKRKADERLLEKRKRKASKRLEKRKRRESAKALKKADKALKRTKSTGDWLKDQQSAIKGKRRRRRRRR